MNKFTTLVLVCMSVSLSGRINAASITFDDVVAGTIITNQYANLGVVFSIDHPNAQPITATGVFNEQAISPSNWLTNNIDPFDNPQLTIRADFVDPSDGLSPSTVSTVSFTYVSDQKGAGRLEAYDALGNLLDQTISVLGEDPPVTPGIIGDEVETLSVFAEDISYVLIYPDLDVLVDNFTFNPVPLPGAVWLFGSGLAFLAGIRLRSKKY